MKLIPGKFPSEWYLKQSLTFLTRIINSTVLLCNLWIHKSTLRTTEIPPVVFLLKFENYGKINSGYSDISSC